LKDITKNTIVMIRSIPYRTNPIIECLDNDDCQAFDELVSTGQINLVHHGTSIFKLACEGKRTRIILHIVNNYRQLLHLFSVSEENIRTLIITGECDIAKQLLNVLPSSTHSYEIIRAIMEHDRIEMTDIIRTVYENGEGRTMTMNLIMTYPCQKILKYMVCTGMFGDEMEWIEIANRCAELLMGEELLSCANHVISEYLVEELVILQLRFSYELFSSMVRKVRYDISRDNWKILRISAFLGNIDIVRNIATRDNCYISGALAAAISGGKLDTIQYIVESSLDSLNDKHLLQAIYTMKEDIIQYIIGRVMLNQEHIDLANSLGINV
jgi:hypothetical protein